MKFIIDLALYGSVCFSSVLPMHSDQGALAMQSILTFKEELTLPILHEALNLFKDSYNQWSAIPKFELKQDGSLVSDFEKDVEEKICNRLKQITPWISFQGEEGTNYQADNNEGYKWYVDPIDGTISFKNDLDTFAFTLTLSHGLSPLAMIAYFPRLDKTYHAIEGQGAYCNGQPIKVRIDEINTHNVIARSDDYVFKTYNSPHTLEQLSTFPAILRTYTDIHAYCLAAEGKITAKIDAAGALWDLMPGMLLMLESGGFSSFYFMDTPTEDCYGSLIVGSETVVKRIHDHLYPGKDIICNKIPEQLL